MTDSDPTALYVGTPGCAGVSSANDALTLLAASIVTVHAEPTSLAHPDQAAKREPVAATASSVTIEPASKSAAQMGPQSMMGGVESTVPLPLPVVATSSRKAVVTKRAPSRGTLPMIVRCNAR